MSRVLRKVLITGGAGFIGTALTKKLVQKGFEIRIIDSFSSQIHGHKTKDEATLTISEGPIEYINSDILTKSEMVKALDGIDVLIHLAAETGTGQSMYEMRRYSETNVTGTANILEVIGKQKLPIKKIVVASTRAVYGEGKYFCDEHGVLYPTVRNQSQMDLGRFEFNCPFCGKSIKSQPSSEDSRLQPTSIYGITKLAQEQMVLNFGLNHDIATIALRFQNVYGPGQSLLNPYTGILSIFSTRIRSGSSIEIFEDGFESRDFVYIDDAIEMTLLAILDDRKHIDVFNVGSGISTNVTEVVKLLKASFKLEVPTTISGRFRKGDIRHNSADTTKFNENFGYRANTSIEVGITQFVEWVLKQPIYDDNYRESLEELRANGLMK